MNSLMNTAMDKVLEYMWIQEDEHFVQYYLNDEDTKNIDLFTKKLKEHILYHVIVMANNGDEEAIDKCIKNYWEQHKMVDDEDEEEN